MKDDVNDELHDGTPKIIILSDGVLNWNKVSKSSNKPKGDHATHFKS